MYVIQLLKSYSQNFGHNFLKSDIKSALMITLTILQPAKENTPSILVLKQYVTLKINHLFKYNKKTYIPMHLTMPNA